MALPLVCRPRPRPDLVRIGSRYGGWWVPADLLDTTSVCYLAGVGEDISFDLGLIERFGCRVLALDPTPRAAEFVRLADPGDGFEFLPVGLAGEDGSARFYVPRNPANVSHSMTNLQGTADYFTAPVSTVASVLRARGDAVVDLLKLDVEGAEHQVLDSLHRDQVFPRIVCVEFDQPDPLAASWLAVRRLAGAGYDVVKVEHFNVTLVRRQVHRVP